MNFLETAFYVTKPVLAIHVPFVKDEPIHNNRPSHGLAYIADGEHLYTFEGLVRAKAKIIAVGVKDNM